LPEAVLSLTKTMVLIVWQDDDGHPGQVIEWAKELNPPPAIAWFKAGCPNRN
jgi:hypothetical protein